MVWNIAAVAQTYQEYGRALQNLGWSSYPFHAMVLEYPMQFGSTADGDLMNLVCKVVTFDHEHTCHYMECMPGGQRFCLEGLLDGSFTTFTLLGCRLKHQFPMPCVELTGQTYVMGHKVPTWDAIRSLIDLCAGFGGLAQAAIAAGFDIAVAVDQNCKMLDLYSKASGAPRVCGDFGEKRVLYEIWEKAGGAVALSSGFSCQPFSKLGDMKSCGDTRANCLTKTLAAAFFLQARLVVLECVSPASNDSFVRSEIEHFMKVTGFTCAQVNLQLEQLWPARRHRAWWLLVAPEFGPIEMKPWFCQSNVTMVNQIIPSIRLWDMSDEFELKLDEAELEAFGVTRDEHGRYLLNGKAIAPCALHAWGSQIRSCPCGCRNFPFSAERLATKGLHGCLVRSASYGDDETHIRHLHPNEAMGLNTMDPILDFGQQVRLTLSAVGQIAAPLQALWVFGFATAKFDLLQFGESQFDSYAQIQAYRAWLLMRCRQVWPSVDEPIQDPNLKQLIQFWGPYRDVSLEELLHPTKWQGNIQVTTSIAAVLDCIIKSQDVTSPSQFPGVESSELEPPTPWYDSPGVVDDDTTAGCMCADSCTVMFEGSADSPVRIQLKCCSTVGDFLKAHEKLVGNFCISSMTLNGTPITREHIMEVGQVIVVKLSPESATLAEPNKECHATAIDSPIQVSPTADWTQPVHDATTIGSPPRKVSRFDVGECAIPKPEDVSETSWLDANPLIGLKGSQFLKLMIPSMANTHQLWAVRHQFLRTHDRKEILTQQGKYWSDDEIRFHLAHLADLHAQCNKSKQVRVMDPLLASAWVQHRGFDCALWAKDHMEVPQSQSIVITAVLLNQHWVPIFMNPNGATLHVHTWDTQDAQHEQIVQVMKRLATAWGFADVLMCQDRRLFFTSELCGALAIAFLRFMLLGNQLPTQESDAEYIHSRLRSHFAESIDKCQISHRPWIWGAGDQSEQSSRTEPYQAIKIDREARIDLINAHGKSMADDEIRYHICQLVDRQPPRDDASSFTFFEPLVFSCWESIGPRIAEQWCSQHPEIFQEGKQFVSAIVHQEHWLPLWFVPSNTTLQIHTLNDVERMVDLDSKLEYIANRLGFETWAIHRIPTAFDTKDLCGAYAMCFLAHIIMRVPLPDDYQELRTFHTNMRASFVAYLYSVTLTPQPVVWGNGPKREVGTSPFMPDENAEETEEETATPCCCFPFAQIGETSEMPGDFCVCSASGMIAETEADQARMAKFNRLMMLGRHGHAMGDDEVLFHLHHLVDCHATRPASSHQESRVFEVIPPLVVAAWLHGEPEQMQEWITTNSGVKHKHLISVGWMDNHWFPIWLEPREEHIVCHTFHTTDDARVDQAIGELIVLLGHTNRVVHRVPNPRYASGLCGAMAISLLAQIVLRTPMPCSDLDLRHRSWRMKETFADFIEPGHSPPALWGWGILATPGVTWQSLKTMIQKMILPWELQPLLKLPGSTCSGAQACDQDASLAALHAPERLARISKPCPKLPGAFGAHAMVRTCIDNGPIIPPIDCNGNIWESRPLPIMPGDENSWSASICLAVDASCPGESRPLPKLPGAFQASHTQEIDECQFADQLAPVPTVSHTSLDLNASSQLKDHDAMWTSLGAMSAAAMKFHLQALTQQRANTCSAVCLDFESLHVQLHTFIAAQADMMIGVILEDLHWFPFIAHRTAEETHVIAEHCDMFDQVIPCFQDVTFRVFAARIEPFCGARAIKAFRVLLGLPAGLAPHDLHRMLQKGFTACITVEDPCQEWGFGPHGQLLKNLMAELEKHGVPATVVESRAQAAIQTLGSEQLLAALSNRNPWKQLKQLGNNSKFQFVMPSELASSVEKNRGQTIAGKGKGKGKTKGKSILPAMELDPNKLQILESTFCCGSQVLSQLRPNQIGPISSGVILMSHQEAEPYLRAGKVVSQEPLAIAVLVKGNGEVHTSLPHAEVTVPCKCTVDSEPVLADAILVQLGKGFVEKVVCQSVVQIDTLEAVTLKILVYKDEIKGTWEDFCQSPIKYLVSALPKLKRCHQDSCSCDAWHNKELLDVRDPILDVWRRQYLRYGFKPSPPSKADMFSVCIRIPRALLDTLLSASGTAGAYFEPRTADGTEILQDFTVVWTPKQTLLEMLHLQQTNPAVTGLARLGERRGVRVHTSQAKSVHQLIRPEAVYLPSGPRSVFTVGPMPYGVDRQAVGKILSQSGWECRPLQPTTPCIGKGAMWLVQSTEEPPKPIIHTTHGEIVIVKQQKEQVEQTTKSHPVGAASTLALCGTGGKATPDNDPWSKADPWRGYKPSCPAPTATGLTEGLQQIECRIQKAVLDKMQPPMEQDDLPDRVHVLEGQVQQLLAQQQGFENQLQDFGHQHTQQINALQGQINTQSQQLHGHLENQNQTIQSLFEQQMSQIRGLLAKRPREEGMK